MEQNSEKVSEKMNKIMVIGVGSGVGKSTFAADLAN